MNYKQSAANNKKTRKKTNLTKTKNKVGVLVFRIFIAFFLISVFTVCGVAAGIYFGILAKVEKLDITMPIYENYTSIIYNDKNEEIARLVGGESSEFVAFEDIPYYVRFAFVAIEDERFYSHNGIDVRGVFRALSVILTSSDTQGASTITQQLVKNKLNLKRNTLITKIQEQYLAIEYEKDMTEAYKSKEAAKDKILEIYLNSIGLGYGQVGVQAASLRYFNKDVGELTLAESAVIAAITSSAQKLCSVISMVTV